ncbi:MAG: cupin domain-containing protein [Candidatus Eremiobacteraeota bacterium]|nr:cupin domain-containing protein [Candidatus Eremiobacteraeota bacterium]
MLHTSIRFIGLLSFCLFAAGTASATDSAPFDAFGTKMTVVVSNAQAKGLSSTIRTVVPPGGGPPAAHIHTREDEIFVVTRGNFRFWHGKHVVDGNPGAVVFLPRNEAHQFRNIGTTEGEVLFTMMPGTLERFFLEVGKRKFVMPRDMGTVVSLSKAYGITYVRSLEANPAQK